jgi:hypothetical protein
MALSYPLSTPTSIGIAQIEFRAVNAVAYSQSPFTFQGQAHVYQGQAWQVDISLPPVRKDLAEDWVAFLLSLRGQYGTFLLGDPNYDGPRGTATTLAVTGSAGDTSVTATLNGSLKAGDWFSLGSGTSTRLYKVVQDIASTGTMEIYPALRADASSATADVSTPKGCFRLASNETAWSINEMSAYGISFGGMEAL